MSEVNAYFQLIIGNGETKLKIFPGVDGGEMLTIEEVIKYLEKNTIKDYDLKALNKAVISVGDPTEVTVLDKEVFAVNEKLDIKVSEDKKEAVVRFYAPSNIGRILSKEEIIKELNNGKIVFGIDEKVIQNHLFNPKYCHSYVIARGIDPVEGADAYIVYHFDKDIKSKPKVHEDGTVDFHQLENINHVKKGQILATLIPEDTGVPGKDVFGNEIRPKKVIRTILRFGKNIELAQDGLTITSQIDGHVTLEGDRVFVNNVYEVPTDVNTSTGDIDYDGNIIIRGSVRTGFKVRATGNIDVMGVVEAAELHAGGNITIRSGIQGMGKGMLIAKGDVVTNFIESAIVVAEGNINADSVLHSRISAKGVVKILGKNGSIIGGHTRSASLIEAKTIGTSMGTNTIIEVGTDPHVKDRLNQLNKIINEKQIELDKLNQLKKLLEFKKENGTLDRMKKDLLFKSINNISTIKEELAHYSNESEELMSKLQINKSAAIKINGEIYPSVKLSISEDFILINEKFHYCQFKNVNGEIKSSPL